LEAQDQEQDPTLVVLPPVDQQTVALLGMVNAVHQHARGLPVFAREDGKKRFACTRPGCLWLSEWRR